MRFLHGQWMTMTTKIQQELIQNLKNLVQISRLKAKMLSQQIGNILIG